MLNLPRPRTAAMRLDTAFAKLVRRIGERIGIKYESETKETQ